LIRCSSTSVAPVVGYARNYFNRGRNTQLLAINGIHVQFVNPLNPELTVQRKDERFQVSQPVFAALLNTSVSTVQKWEIGQKRPTGTAQKLLHLVQKSGLDIVAQP
jgi:putative transcriptional regulator